MYGRNYEGSEQLRVILIYRKKKEDSRKESEIMDYRIYTDTVKSYMPGHKVNEDRCLFTEFSFMQDKKVRLMIICDGMGGLNDGEVAAQNGVSGFAHTFYREIMSCYLETDMDGFSLEYSIHDVEDAMIKALQCANDKVCAGADSLKATGATLSAVCVFDDFAVVINVGDSPVYFYRAAKKKIKLVSVLQTKAEQDVAEGIYERYSEEYYENDHRIYNSLGLYGELNPENICVTSIGKLEQGDVFLMGSDGAFGRMKEEEIQTMIEYCATGNDGFVLTQLFSRAREDKYDDQTAFLYICTEKTEED
mgnify:FL=1